MSDLFSPEPLTKLEQAIQDVKTATDPKDLLRIVGKVDQGIKDAEFNFPAGIIMGLDVWESHKKAGLLDQVSYPEYFSSTNKIFSSMRKSAELAMLQLAFLNAGENIPCSVIQGCYDAGWRYRIDKDFHRVTL